MSAQPDPDVLADPLDDRLVAPVRHRVRHLDQRSLALAEAEHCMTCSWLRPKVLGLRGLVSRKNGARPISAATYSALVPRLTRPGRSGGRSPVGTPAVGTSGSLGGCGGENGRQGARLAGPERRDAEEGQFDDRGRAVASAGAAATVVLLTPPFPVTKAIRRARTGSTVAEARGREAGGLRACAGTAATKPAGRPGVVRASPRELGGLAPMPRWPRARRPSP